MATNRTNICIKTNHNVLANEFDETNTTFTFTPDSKVLCSDLDETTATNVETSLAGIFKCTEIIEGADSDFE